jgi:hypothetical protein
MIKDSAEKFAKEVEKQLGANYNMEDLFRYQLDIELITPKSLSEFDIRNEFREIKEINDLLPKKERRSNTGIVDDMAASHNCSLSRVFEVVKDLYHE